MKIIEHPTRIDRLLHWTPRITSLLFVGFISLFAFDVFSAYQGWELVLALFMHLLPSFVLLVATIVAWRHDIFGAIVFCGFAILYILWAGFDRPWTWYALISGPAAFVGILYFMNWLKLRHRKNNN